MPFTASAISPSEKTAWLACGGVQFKREEKPNGLRGRRPRKQEQQLTQRHEGYIRHISGYRVHEAASGMPRLIRIFSSTV